MNEQTKKMWASALEQLNHCPPEQRSHFAHLILRLVSCYDLDSDAQAVILIRTGGDMYTFSAGADEADALDILSFGYHALCDKKVAFLPSSDTLQ